MTSSIKILKAWDKQPGDTQDYDIEFEDWLKKLGDTPSLATPPQVTVAPAGITLLSSSLNGTAVKVWLSGGAPGVRYKVSAKLTTVGGREKEADILINVREV